MPGQMMDSKEESIGSSHIVAPSQHKQYDALDGYEDDFEELDTFIKEKPSESTSNMRSDSKREDVEKGHNHSDTDFPEEKGQRESSGQIPMEKDKRGPPRYDDTLSDDSEPEAEGEGEVIFTEDQQRAMLELLTQKHCSGDYTGDPLDYNMRERLKEINEELAREPDPEPNSRQTRVGFKKELVDLVAPPPELPDDDDDDDDNVGGSGGGYDEVATRKADNEVSESSSGSEEGPEDKKQYVVERGGKFEIVGDSELSAMERAMLDIPDDEDDDEGADVKRDSNAGSGEKNMDMKERPSKQHKVREQQQVTKANNSVPRENLPQPPSHPRPNTANGHSRSRNVHVPHSPRPHSVNSAPRSHNSGSSLRTSPVFVMDHGSALHEDFSYNSPYAMSPSEKGRAQERARLREQQRKEEERQQREEDEYRRKESEDAFQAWLQNKAGHDRRKRMEEEDRRKRSGEKDDVKARENDEAFRSWLKQKQMQQKREKLLKKREEQSVKDNYYVRSREQCDLAYREWLKKKYTEFRQQRAMEKERQKTFCIMARKARKQQMVTRSLIASSNLKYPDLYGYRF